MQRHLNLDTTEKAVTKRWINDEVVNFYFKKYLAEMDQKQCQEEPEQKL
jgi:Ulp1 family protease